MCLCVAVVVLLAGLACCFILNKLFLVLITRLAIGFSLHRLQSKSLVGTHDAQESGERCNINTPNQKYFSKEVIFKSKNEKNWKIVLLKFEILSRTV